jgi:hypothetical protein
MDELSILLSAHIFRLTCTSFSLRGWCVAAFLALKDERLEKFYDLHLRAFGMTIDMWPRDQYDGSFLMFLIPLYAFNAGAWSSVFSRGFCF